MNGDAPKTGDRSKFSRVAAPAGWAGGKVRTVSAGRATRQARRAIARADKKAAAQAEAARIVTMRNTQPGAREWASIRRVRGA